MNVQQAEWLKSLDPNQMSGTIQRVFHEGNLETVPFEGLIKHLLRVTMDEKAGLEKENNNMKQFLRDKGLYCAGAIGLKE